MKTANRTTCGGMTRRWRAVGATAALPRGAGRRARGGFTLTEMLIVIGIIVLIVALAVPAFRAMTGGRSVDAAQNQLAAILGQARAEAIGLQKMRGVLFILDPATDRVNAVLVEDGGRPEELTGTDDDLAPDVFLDAIPNRDPVPLPVGVGLQVIDNANVTVTGATRTRNDDGYIGFNLPPVSGTIGGGGGPARQVRVGGVILFDAYGRLVNKRYGFLIGREDPSAAGAQPRRPTRVAELLGFNPGGAEPPEYIFQRQNVSGGRGGGPENTRPPRSQFGFVLYDAEPFRNLNYTPGDPQFSDSDAGSYTGPEGQEEKWLDDNSFPVLVNRYNGTLVRAE